MEFKSDLPYPKIRVERQNINYATKLLNDYAGYVSELSAIHLYSYQSFVSDKYRAYKDIIMKIVTNKHLIIILSRRLKNMTDTKNTKIHLNWFFKDIPMYYILCAAMIGKTA